MTGPLPCTEYAAMHTASLGVICAAYIWNSDSWHSLLLRQRYSCSRYSRHMHYLSKSQSDMDTCRLFAFASTASPGEPPHESP